VERQWTVGIHLLIRVDEDDQEDRSYRGLRGAFSHLLRSRTLLGRAVAAFAVTVVAAVAGLVAVFLQYGGTTPASIVWPTYLARIAVCVAGSYGALAVNPGGRSPANSAKHSVTRNQSRGNRIKPLSDDCCDQAGGGLGPRSTSGRKPCEKLVGTPSRAFIRREETQVGLDQDTIAIQQAALEIHTLLQCIHANPQTGPCEGHPEIGMSSEAA